MGSCACSLWDFLNVGFLIAVFSLLGMRLFCIVAHVHGAFANNSVSCKFVMIRTIRYVADTDVHVRPRPSSPHRHLHAL